MSSKDTESKLTLARRHLSANDAVLIFDDTAKSPVTYLAARAKNISPATIALFADQARGVIFAAVKESRFKTLSLGLADSMLLGENQRNSNLAFGLSVEARKGVGTGISAADRATTLNALASTENPRNELLTPGHIFTVMAASGGSLVKNSIAEAACDLLDTETDSVAAVCQCLSKDGANIGSEEAERLAKKLSAPIISISEIIFERMKLQPVVTRVDKAKLPILDAPGFKAIIYRSEIDDAEHIALIKGEPQDFKDKKVVVRVQAENKLRDLLGLGNGHSRRAIKASLKRISEENAGIFVYIRHPKKGLLQKQAAEDRKDSKKRDASELALSNRLRTIKEYGVGAQILKDLGAKNLHLLQASKGTIPSLESFGISITETELLKL